MPSFLCKRKVCAPPQSTELMLNGPIERIPYPEVGGGNDHGTASRMVDHDLCQFSDFIIGQNCEQTVACGQDDRL